LSFIFFLASTCLYAASAGLESHSNSKTSIGLPDGISVLQFQSIVGPYTMNIPQQVQQNYGLVGTPSIDQNCQIGYQSSTGTVYHFTVTLDPTTVTANANNIGMFYTPTGTSYCTEFNAYRVLFAVGGIFSLICLILSMVASFCARGSCSRISSIILGTLSFVSGAAGWAIYIDIQNNRQHDTAIGDYLVGFWLHVGATAATLIAVIFATPNPNY